MQPLPSHCSSRPYCINLIPNPSSKPHDPRSGFPSIPDLPHLFDENSCIIHRLQKALINPTTFLPEISLSGRLHNALQLRPYLQNARSRTKLLPRLAMNCSCLDQSVFQLFIADQPVRGLRNSLMTEPTSRSAFRCHTAMAVRPGHSLIPRCS